MRKKYRNTKWLPPYRVFDDGGPTKAQTFANTANLVSGMAGMFDSIAMNISSGIDQNRSGVSDLPKEIVEGVLGAQSGSHLNKMWTSKAKLNEALDYIEDQGDVKYNTTDTDSLLAQYNKNGFLEESNIDTSGSELQSWLFDPLSNLVQFVSGNKKNNTAADRLRKINEAIRETNRKRVAAFNNAVDTMNQKRKLSAMRDSYAFGGGFGFFGQPTYVGGALEYDMMKDNLYNKQLTAMGKSGNDYNLAPMSVSFGEGGGINIKPSKKGTFKTQASKMGMSVQQAASHILAHPENYSPAMRRKANFARNFAHADGGLLLSDNFTNGVSIIGNGGTHENNPHDGVLMGIAPDGAPNLVEEGESIYKNYVFSNRLKVPKEVRSKYKLRGPKDMTFSEAFIEALKESQERENDPISQNGLDNIAMILARTQEAIRGYENAKNHKAAKGGHLLAGGLEDWPIQEYDIIEPAWMNEEDEEMNALLNKFKMDALKNYNGKDKSTKPTSGVSFLRQMPAYALGLAVLSDAFGLTNTATHLDRIPKFSPIAARQLTEYAPVGKWDINYAANQAAAQAAATRAAIMNSASPNKWANLLAADYNAQVAQGDLLRKAAMDQYERDIARATFNRETNRANAELALDADKYNSQGALSYAQALLSQDMLNENLSNTASGARAQNLGNFAEALADIEREKEDRETLQWLIDSGVFGKVAACGGKIKKRKGSKRGLTY